MEGKGNPFMGWERGRYYTRSRKVNGRVVREYIGGGEFCRLVAQMDAIDRDKRAADTAEWQAEKAQLRRAFDSTIVANGGDAVNENAIAKSNGDPSVDEIKLLITRAEKNDEKAATELRMLLDEAPDLADAFGGDLCEQLDRKIVSDAAGKNLSFKEGLRRKLLNLRSELEGKSPTPIERLLVERVTTCWLQLHIAELNWTSAGSMTLAQAEIGSGT